MRYLLTIHTDRSQIPLHSEADMQRLIDAYWELDDEAEQAGALVRSNALRDASEAATVRVHDGRTIVTDGPFAETKEQLGGIYLLDCESLDEALDWAAKVPGAHHGSVEVRPVMEIQGAA